jgi:hypothetical protein
MKELSLPWGASQLFAQKKEYAKLEEFWLESSLCEVKVQLKMFDARVKYRRQTNTRFGKLGGVVSGLRRGRDDVRDCGRDLQ